MCTVVLLFEGAVAFYVAGQPFARFFHDLADRYSGAGGGAIHSNTTERVLHASGG